MEDKLKVKIIPAKPKQRDKKVAVYARVSSNSREQLKSIQAQVSGLTRLTAAKSNWLLVDIYMNIATSKTGSSRKEFNRMVDDSANGKIDIVITKSISRFGRDTVEVLDSLGKLTRSGMIVKFINEAIDTLKVLYIKTLTCQNCCSYAGFLMFCQTVINSLLISCGDGSNVE